MAENRPRGRQKNVTGEGKEIKRRDSGLGTGSVGARDNAHSRNHNQNKENSGEYKKN